MCICILSICFPLSVKLSKGFLIRVGTEEGDSDLPHSAGPAHEYGFITIGSAL